MKSLIVGAAVGFTARDGLANGGFTLGNKKVTLRPQQNKARIEWTRPAVLQSSDTMVPEDCQDLNGAASPFDVEPANAQRFCRLRRPRRGRCGKTAEEPHQASRSAAVLRRFGSSGSARRPSNVPETWCTPKRELTPGVGRGSRAACGVRRFALHFTRIFHR